MLLVYRSSLKGEFIRCVAHSLHCCSVWIVHFGDQSFESLPEAHGPFFAPCVIFHRSVAEAHVEKHGVMFKKVYRRYENCQWSPSWALRTMSKPFRLSTNNWQYLMYISFFSCKVCSSHGYVEYNHMTVTIKFTWERHDFKLIWMSNLYVGNLFCKWSTV